MGTTTSRASFIDSQRQALLEESANIQARLAAAEQAVQPALAAANAAGQELRDRLWKQALAAARKQAIANAGKGAWWQALSLQAVAGGTGRMLLVVWLVVLILGCITGNPLRTVELLLGGYLGPASLPVVLLRSHFFGLVGWAGLVWLGRRRLAKRRASGQLKALEALQSMRPTLYALGQKATDGRAYPYPAARVPASNAAAAVDTWQLSEPHDNSNSVQVGLAEGDGKNLLMLRLPVNGNPAGISMIHAPLTGHMADLKVVAPLLAAQLATLAPPVQSLLAALPPLAREQEALRAIKARLVSLDKLEASWKDVAIPNDTLETIIKLVDRFAAGVAPLPRGILMWGPPGTGKTLIARKLAQHVDCNFVAVTIADLKAEYIGQTGPKVKKLWAEARSKGPTILFVDECESAFARRGGRDTDAFGNELVQTFIAEWDGFNQGGGNVLVIGATNRRELIDDAVLSRFSSSIELPAPNAEARQRILASEFAKANLGLPVTEALVRETTGMSGRDLSTLVTNVVSGHPAGQPAIEDFVAAVARLRGKSSTSVKTLTWDDIILPAATRREFESLGKELVHAEELAKMNLPVPRGILLYGPPGTGKTQIARVLASQSGLSFLAASSADLKSSNIGASGEKVKQLFERARAQAPCILFLDELDTIARSRDGGDTMTTEIVAQMLQELDGIGSRPGQVFLLAATNLPDSIDAALLSRLERKIEVGLPDLEARRGIVRLQLTGKPIEGDLAAIIEQLAQATDGLSGRDLQSLVTAGTRTALQRAMVEHGDPTKVSIGADDLLEQLASKA